MAPKHSLLHTTTALLPPTPLQDTTHPYRRQYPALGPSLQIDWKLHLMGKGKGRRYAAIEDDRNGVDFGYELVSKSKVRSICNVFMYVCMYVQMYGVCNEVYGYIVQTVIRCK